MTLEVGKDAIIYSFPPQLYRDDFILFGAPNSGLFSVTPSGWGLVTRMGALQLVHSRMGKRCLTNLTSHKAVVKTQSATKSSRSHCLRVTKKHRYVCGRYICIYIIYIYLNLYIISQY